MDDARRNRVSSTGRVERICTLCEEEARPYVKAHYEYVVVSTRNGDKRRITICADHANQLNKRKLPYEVVSRKKGSGRAHTT